MLNRTFAGFHGLFIGGNEAVYCQKIHKNQLLDCSKGGAGHEHLSMLFRIFAVYIKLEVDSLDAHDKKLQWLALLAAALSFAWLISHPDYEPAVALASSLLAWLGLKRHRSHNAEVSPLTPVGQPSGTKAQFHLSALLEGAYMADRPRIVKESLGAFPSVTPVDVAEILGLLYQADRLHILAVLAPRISPPPSSKEATKILGQLYVADRPSGAKLLAQVHVASQ